MITARLCRLADDGCALSSVVSFDRPAERLPGIRRADDGARYTVSPAWTYEVKLDGYRAIVR